MRGLLIVLVIVMVGMVCAGCMDSSKSKPAPRSSVLVFSYDAARDASIARTRPLATTDEITPQRYAEELENYTEIMPVATYRLADPKATVTDGTVTVDYQMASTRGTLTDAQIAEARTTLESWFWVPKVRQANFQAKGAPLALATAEAYPQPASPTFHAYFIQPDTGEVAHLNGSAAPKDVKEAISLLQKGDISAGAKKQGFAPLLPAGVKLAADPTKIDGGVLTVNFSADVQPDDDARLAGIVLMLTQFSEVEAVQFIIDGKTVARPVMRGNLNAPLTPYLLLLPTDVAALLPKDTALPVQNAVQAEVGRVPLTFGSVKSWRNWALVTATREASEERQTYILKHEGDGTYTMKLKGAALTAAQIHDTVPAEAIVALRLPGWEDAARETGL